MKIFRLLEIKLLGKKIGQLLDQRFAPIGLTDTRAKILGALSHHPDLTAKDLLPWAEVEPASMTALLQGLERDGLIERKPHPTDRRAVLLSITDDGRALHQKAITVLERARVDLFSVLSEEEAEEYHRLNGLLFRRLEELGVAHRGRESTKE